MMMEDEKLIQLVQENKLLYDKSSPLFRNKQKKQEVWEAVAAELGCSIDQCTRRWTSLRDRYSKLCREQNCPSGSGAAELPTWHLFDQLAFLSNHIKPRQTICTQSAISSPSPRDSQSSTPMSPLSPAMSPLVPAMSPLAPAMSPLARAMSPVETTSQLSATQSVFNFATASTSQLTNSHSNETPAKGRKRRNTDCVDKALMSALGSFENRCKMQQNANKKLQGFATMLAAMIEELPQQLHARAMTDAMNAVSALQNVEDIQIEDFI